MMVLRFQIGLRISILGAVMNAVGFLLNVIDVYSGKKHGEKIVKQIFKKSERLRCHTVKLTQRTCPDSVDYESV